MIASLIWIVLIVVIAGVIVWGIDSLPAIDPTFRQVAKVIIIVAMVIIVVLAIAGLLGVGPGVPWHR